MNAGSLNSEPITTLFTSELSGTAYRIGVIISSKMPRRLRAPVLYSNAIWAICSNTFGLIPEFTGRLPIVAHFADLSRKMLVRIMTEPKDSIYSQFREIFRTENVELIVNPLVFDQIAEIAFEYKTGARSLRGIFEELVTPVLYVVPDRSDISKVVIASMFTEPTFT